MTYEECLNYLYNATPQFQQIGAAAYKPGLDTTIALDNAFGNCHKYYKTIHVGGTNGKGSTSHTIASILQEQGYKVGLYTSPHLVDFRERIRINGEKITQEAVCDFIDRYRKLELDLSPSFFELTTIMAFDYFKSQKVDYAVIEVGLGGRLDCTNIISPIISVITNISKDHTAQLGNSLESIAGEKSGIIKPGTPVVIGEANGEIRRIFQEKADSVCAKIIFAQEQDYLIKSYKKHNDCIVYDTVFGKITSPLAGDYQIKNMQTILTTIHALNDNILRIKPEAVVQGCVNVLKNTHLLGRWTVLSKNPTIISDTGHNIGGWEYLSKQLDRISNNHKLFMVIGFVSDKDVDSILSLMPQNATYLLTQASVPRAMDVNILASKYSQHHIDAIKFTSVPAAIDYAKSQANSDDVIFIGGSTFVVADAMNYLNQHFTY